MLPRSSVLASQSSQLVSLPGKYFLRHVTRVGQAEDAHLDAYGGGGDPQGACHRRRLLALLLLLHLPARRSPNCCICCTASVC